MSVVWIKVNRENKTHSIYCDGQVTTCEGEIRDDSRCKFNLLKIENRNILIGATGTGYNCDYLLAHLHEELTNIVIENILNLLKSPLTIRNAEEILNDIIEKIMQQKFKNNKINYYPSIILSIDGYLFQGNGFNFSDMAEDENQYYRFAISYRNKNHIECGAGWMEIKALLEYDNNADPQKILNITASIEDSVNNNLCKLENIKYKNNQ